VKIGFTSECENPNPRKRGFEIEENSVKLKLKKNDYGSADETVFLTTAFAEVERDEPSFVRGQFLTA
jgi:hypothetical protein